LGSSPCILLLLEYCSLLVGVLLFKPICSSPLVNTTLHVLLYYLRCRFILRLRNKTLAHHLMLCHSSCAMILHYRYSTISLSLAADDFERTKKVP
jgi:hypothetical protein